MKSAAEKIAAAALKWSEAEAAKKAAKRAFADAMAPCFVEVPRANDWPESKPLFAIHREYDEWGVRYNNLWVYSEHAPEELRGQECEGDERWIAQSKAWSAFKEATRAAGIARGALTRMCNRERAQ